MEKQNCAETVFDKVSSNFYPCTRAGKLWYEGKIYCKQHHPPEIESRRDARARVWQKEVMAEATVSRLNDAAPDLLEALKNILGAIDYRMADLKPEEKFDAIDREHGGAVAIGWLAGKKAISKAEPEKQD